MKERTGKRLCRHKWAVRRTSNPNYIDICVCTKCGAKRRSPKLVEYIRRTCKHPIEKQALIGREHKEEYCTICGRIVALEEE